MSANELTLKQQRFLNAYIETGNATEAARIAGYKGDDNQLGVVGHGNLRKYKIRQFIDERLSEERITSNEVLQILASQARADAADLFDEHGRFSLDHLRQNRLGHLIKKIKCKRVIEGSGEDARPVEMIEVELHSSQAAIAQLCKIQGWEQLPSINDRDYARSGESALQTWLARAATAQGLSDPLPPTRENVQMWIDSVRPGAQDMPDLLAFLDQKEQSLARGQDSEAVS